MPESTSLGRLLGLAGIAVWLGSPPSPAEAQVEKSRPGAEAAAKPPVEDKGLPRISLLRLQVVKPDPGQPDGPPGFPRRNRFGFEAAPREGTSLTFTFDEPDQVILGLEAKDCKITRFRDDKDTDLAPDGKEPAAAGMIVAPRFGQEEGPLSAEVDPAGHRATITVHSPRFPAGGANRLMLEAVLAVRYGRGEKIVEQKNVNLKVDKLTVGPIPLVVMSQDGAGQGMMPRGEGTQVTLFHHQTLSEIRKVVFIGPDGKEIPTNGSGQGSNGSIYMTNYSLAKKVETCTIRLTVPETIETVHMAVAINTGVGFPPFASRRIIPAAERLRIPTGAAPK